jgi:hypothetical protein
MKALKMKKRKGERVTGIVIAMSGTLEWAA